MEFINGNIGPNIKFEEILRQSKKAILATAYFSPRASSLDALKHVQDLKLIYSDEYQVTDPDKLWDLVSHGAQVRFVPANNLDGRLHAKVFCGILNEGIKYAFVGSANLTDYGLFYNQEAGLYFNSNNTLTDSPIIENIDKWISELWINYKDNIFNEAKYNEAKERRAAIKKWLNTNPEDINNNTNKWKINTHVKYCQSWNEIKYYAVMPGKKAAGEDFHKEFYKYQLIGIGYTITDSEGKRMVAKLRKMKIGDLILVCRGYNTQNHHDVPIFSFARIIDNELRDYQNNSSCLTSISKTDMKFKIWLKHWRNAVVLEPDGQIFEDNFVLADLLGRGSLEHAVQDLKPEGFDKLSSELYDKYGIVLNI